MVLGDRLGQRFATHEAVKQLAHVSAADHAACADILARLVELLALPLKAIVFRTGHARSLSP